MTRIALAGNPNAGKTTLFNALTGARARTGNYPGITVDRRVGSWSLSDERRVSVVDIPGTYSLTARSSEEQIAVDAILPRESDEEAPSVVVVVVDATTLERHLYLAAQVIATGRPTVIALNMMDEAEAGGVSVDHAALGTAVGATVVPIVARTGKGLDALAEAVEARLENDFEETEPEEVPDGLSEYVVELEAALEAIRPEDSPTERRARAIWALLSLGDDELDVFESLRTMVESLRQRAAESERDIDREIIGARYERIDAWIAEAVDRRTLRLTRPLTDRLDRVLTHPVAGFLIFALVMFGLFEALFSGSEPLIAAIEWLVMGFQGLVTSTLPAGPFTDLLVEGVIAGVGNVVVFVPQIAMLFAFIAVLEDSGYLARVAFVIDRVMRGVGLHGKAFVPLLSGYACAVPAVMATRTIENRRDRIVTMMALPLMSCSARLPVYALVIAVVFPTEHRFFGIVSLGALVMFAMYGLSLIATLGSAAVMRRTILKGPRPALVLELPPYRMPGLRNVWTAVLGRLRSFLVDAGTIILAITIVLWGLLSFPSDDSIAARYDELRAGAALELEGDALEARTGELDAEEARDQLPESYAGRLGRSIEPLIEPLGFDWRIGVGLIGSFAAREVLVSTLGVVWGIDSAEDDSVPLRESLRDAARPDGSPLFTPLTGLSLMVFFVLAAQCMSTLAVVKRETNSWRWPIFMFAYMSVLAYLGSLITYQGGLLLGFS